MKEVTLPLIALFAFALLLPIFMRLFMWWIAFYVGSGGEPQSLSAFVPTPEQRARQVEGMTNLRRAWAAAGTAAPCAYCRGTSRTAKGRCESCGAQEVR